MAVCNFLGVMLATVLQHVRLAILRALSHAEGMLVQDACNNVA